MISTFDFLFWVLLLSQTYMCTGDCTYMFHHVVEDYTIIPCTYNFINLTTGVLVTVPHSNIWSLDLRNNTVPFFTETERPGRCDCLSAYSFTKHFERHLVFWDITQREKVSVHINDQHHFEHKKKTTYQQNQHHIDVALSQDRQHSLDHLEQPARVSPAVPLLPFSFHNHKA